MTSWRTLRRLARPLPLAMLVMALLLAMKLNHLLGGTQAALGSAGRAVLPAAQAASGHVPAHPAPAPPPVVAPAVPAPIPAPAEPVISEAERSILLQLRTRRDAIEAREREMAGREAVLAAAEKRLTERVDQLTALQGRLEQLDTTRRERGEANWQGLVKTYETMRPRDAAMILNEMESSVLIEVLDRMKEAKAAQVLAAMLPDRARAATAQLAHMRSKLVTPPTAGPQG